MNKNSQFDFFRRKLSIILLDPVMKKYIKEEEKKRIGEEIIQEYENEIFKFAEKS